VGLLKPPVEQELSWLESVMTKRLVVHLVSGQSMEGSLSAITADGIILRAAKLLLPEQKSTGMAGEVYIPREQVAFAQLS
jgi:hypothetical protein